MDVAKLIRKMAVYGVMAAGLLYGGCDRIAQEYLKPHYADKVIAVRKRAQRLVERGAIAGVALLEKKIAEIEQEVDTYENKQ